MSAHLPPDDGRADIPRPDDEPTVTLTPVGPGAAVLRPPAAVVPAGPATAVATAGPAPVPPPLVAGDPPGLSRLVTPGAVLAALRACWPVAVPVGLLLGGAAGFAAWQYRPDKVTAFALLRVSPAPERVLTDAAQPMDGGSYARTQMALIRSRPVLRAALKQDKVRGLPAVAGRPDPVEWLERELRAEPVDGTELLRVSLTQRGDGADLAPVVNAVTAAYMDEVVQREHATQLAHLNDLQKIYSACEEKLRNLRESFLGLTRDLKGGDPKVLTLRQQTLLNEYAALKREVAGLNGRCRDLEIRAATYRQRLAGPAAGAKPPAGQAAAHLDVLVEQELDADPRVRAAEDEAARLRDRLKQLDALTASPTVKFRVDTQKQLAAAEAAVADVRRDREAVARGRHQRLAAATAGAGAQEAEAELGVLRQQRDGLQAEVDGLRQQVDRLGLDSVELELRRAEIDRSEQFLRAVWEQKERLEVELKGSARQRVTVVSAAEEATVLNKLGRLQEAAAAGLGGLAVGLLAVALLELRRGRIRHPADVSRGLRLRVLGTLPSLPPVPAAAPPALAGWSTRKYLTGAVEAIDGLRTALLYEPFPAACPVLMVTSPAPNEGKTTLAAHLAASLARAGRRTLLIDCDLRAPSLHRLFGLPPGPGVCDLLTGAARPADAARPTDIPGLHVLPAGGFCQRSAAALAQTDLPAVLAELRGRYDFILIDSSPLLRVPDGLMLARHVDGLLLSVRPGVSSGAEVYATTERLREHRLPFVGTVVNGVPDPAGYRRKYDRRALPAAAAAVTTA